MLSVSSVVLNTPDPARLAAFWCAALSARVRYDWGAYVVLDCTPALCFQRVDDPPSGARRLHIDLGADDADAEIERLVELGASRLSSVTMNGASWVVLADPDGNEFCVVRSFDENLVRRARPRPRHAAADRP